MRFGLLYEHQLPKPWAPDDEHQLFKDALAQVELADRLGFDYVWAVEHHFLEEYSHSSASDVFLAACSQRTKNIRLGFGILPLPPGYQHPARVAETVATLDLVSDGRAEFGTGETSSGAELEGFGVDRATKRAQWAEALDVVTRMFVEEPFAGVDGRYLTMPPRNVVPKPLQKPHPPLWVACSRRDTILLAAETGIGALSFSFAEPEEAAEWVREYEEIIAGERCLPIGFDVNAQIATALPMMVARDEADAIERGVDGAHFFGYALAHYYYFADHRPGVTSIAEDFEETRHEVGFARDVVVPEGEPLGVKVMSEGPESIRGAIGTPEQVAELCRRYEEAGVDQMIFLVQTGRTKHEHVCEALELFAAEVMPEFHERAPAHEAAKRERLAGAVAAALERREPARTAPADAVISPMASGPPPAVVGAGAPPAPEPVVAAPAANGAPAKTGTQAFFGTAMVRAQQRGEAAFGTFVRRSDDRRLERTVGADPVLAVIFNAMARRFDAGAANGFTGQIQWTMRAERGTKAWTLDIDGRRARARPGEAEEPKLVLTLSMADFARVIAEDLHPAKALITGRLQVRGDLALAAKLGPMFGQASAL
ncbi:LLM class flavin-dependent oxidoreductase [Svornostia abyssi]|uniref:LLM class flavin-dependent oxidoreductase n=1 Tax=Svornostia abyssi TaxID=2898438 RepID=A0ABY5PB40_9ACTN|nr:LLM class flavin-dependent oxidoreductase [Parviterribacteraceae bacterium J379]